MTEATARPWQVTQRRYDGGVRPSTDFTVSSDGTFVAAFHKEQDATDAVRSVAAHDSLMKALRQIETQTGEPWVRKVARAAIAKGEATT